MDEIKELALKIMNGEHINDEFLEGKYSKNADWSFDKLITMIESAIQERQSRRLLGEIYEKPRR